MGRSRNIIIGSGLRIERPERTHSALLIAILVVRYKDAKVLLSQTAGVCYNGARQEAARQAGSYEERRRKTNLFVPS